MPQNVEYPTLPLNKNVKFVTFLGWKYPKSSNKRQRYLIIIWLHANYLFYAKTHVNVNKNCENEKKKKVECGKAHFTSLKMLFVINEAAIGPTLT